MTTEISLGALLCDQAPELYNIVSGCCESDRSLELIRLGSIVPAGCHGYVEQLRLGSRSVRLDAARQLQRAGIIFDVEIPSR